MTLDISVQKTKKSTKTNPVSTNNNLSPSLVSSNNEMVSSSLDPTEASSKLGQASDKLASNEFPLIQAPTNVIQAKTDANKLRASRPFHKRVQASLLSSGSEEPNFRGLMNLAMLALLAMTVRLIIENSLKYGFLLSFNVSGIDFSTWIPDICALIFNIVFFPQMAWLLEKCTFDKDSIPMPTKSLKTKSGNYDHSQSKKTQGKKGNSKNRQNGNQNSKKNKNNAMDEFEFEDQEHVELKADSKPESISPSGTSPLYRQWYQFINPRFTVYLQLVSISVMFFGSMFVIHYSAASILPGVMLAFVTLVLTMKLISYAHVSYDVRIGGNMIALLPNGALIPYSLDSPPTLDMLDGTCHHTHSHPMPSSDELRHLHDLSDTSEVSDGSDLSDANENSDGTGSGNTSPRNGNQHNTLTQRNGIMKKSKDSPVREDNHRHVHWNEQLATSQSLPTTVPKKKSKSPKTGSDSSNGHIKPLGPIQSAASSDFDDTADDAGAPLTHLSGYSRFTKSFQLQLRASFDKLQATLQKQTLETRDKLAELFPVFRAVDSRVCILSRLAIKNAENNRESLSGPTPQTSDQLTTRLSSGPSQAYGFTYKSMRYIPDLKQLHYFLCCPTLVFQLSYPRSDSISIFFIFRRLFEMLVCFSIILLTIGQYVQPTLINSINYFDNGDLVMILERILKLCIPNTIVWLLMFYGFFHSYLNFVAEIFRFGDRIFYRDWWNSGDLGVYWRLWNRPVHDWLVKHVYCILIRRGVKSQYSQIFVFFISALLHEVLISVPCHMLCAHAFLGMFMQVPIISITKWIYKKTGNAVFGNVTFWCFFCIFGQPLLVLLYGYEYISKYKLF